MRNKRDSYKRKNFLLKNLSNSLDIINIASTLECNNNRLSSINNSESNSMHEEISINNKYNYDFTFTNRSHSSYINREEEGNNNINQQLEKYFINNKIFNIKKDIKLGRKRKNCTIERKHNKYMRDNILRKFKVHLTSSIINYVNSLFLINEKRKKKLKIFRRLSSSKIKKISKKENINWLNSKVKYILSENVSSKLTSCTRDFNVKIIQRVYEKNEEKKVIEILEKTIREMRQIYINDTYDNNYKGFMTLEDDIKKMKMSGENDIYINEYKNVGIEFEKIFNSIKPRRKKLSILQKK